MCVDAIPHQLDSFKLLPDSIQLLVLQLDPLSLRHQLLLLLGEESALGSYLHA